VANAARYQGGKSIVVFCFICA